MDPESATMIKAVLEQHYEQVGVTIVNDVHDLVILAAKQSDLAYLGLKELEEGWLTTYLDELGINYFGSTAPAIALDLSKPLTKQVVKAAGMSTSNYFMAAPGQYRNSNALPLKFPLFVKPPNTGGGNGIGNDSVVRDWTAFTTKVQSITDNYQSEALVEEYLPGREFSVAIMANLNSKKLTAMPIELIAAPNDRGDRILGLKAKEADTEQVVAVADGSLKQALMEMAVQVFKILGARDYGRIDIRLDGQGIPRFLEANLIPGSSSHGYFARACMLNLSMDYETMLLHFAELGLSRTPDITADPLGVAVAINPALPALV